MSSGKKKNNQGAHRRFRQKLESWGMPYAEIQLCVSQMRERQALKANGRLPIDASLCTRAEYVRYLKKQIGVTKQGAPVLCLGDDFTTPDDKTYKPTRIDSTLTGVGRATGETAKAVKRGKTITKFQYDERDNGCR